MVVSHRRSAANAVVVAVVRGVVVAVVEVAVVVGVVVSVVPGVVVAVVEVAVVVGVVVLRNWHSELITPPLNCATAAASAVVTALHSTAGDGTSTISDPNAHVNRGSPAPSVVATTVLSTATLCSHAAGDDVAKLN